MVAITFKGYNVNKMLYMQNEKFKYHDKKLKMKEPGFVVGIEINNTEAHIHLETKIGEDKTEEDPFYIEIKIVALFEYENAEKNIKEILSINTLAILFPYIRSLVSDLTSRSNIFPTYIMPTFNIIDFVSKDSVTIQDNRDFN